jgi:hypothetical protein
MRVVLCLRVSDEHYSEILAHQPSFFNLNYFLLKKYLEKLTDYQPKLSIQIRNTHVGINNHSSLMQESRMFVGNFKAQSTCLNNVIRKPLS